MKCPVTLSVLLVSIGLTSCRPRPVETEKEVETYCGDGYIDPGEACDGSTFAGNCADEGFLRGTLACTLDCHVDTSGCSNSALTNCGNGAIDAGETCDGTNLGSATCTSLGYSSGTLTCDNNCSLSTAACVAAAGCGDGAIGAGEACDGLNLNSETCASLGFIAGGTLSCAGSCASFDTAGCKKLVVNEVSSSGDDPIEFMNVTTEPLDISGWYFLDNVTNDFISRPPFYFPAGTVIPAYGYYDVSQNPSHPRPYGWGPNSVGLSTEGDSVNLYNAAGVLVDTISWGSNEAASGLCRVPNGSGSFQVCAEMTLGSANWGCGDGSVHAPEETCDGTDLASATCSSEGFYAGTLACNASCTAFVTTGCHHCGNGTIDSGEVCDTNGPQLGGQDCVQRGYLSGTLGCAADCKAFDETACVSDADCGNAMLDAGEACDPNDSNPSSPILGGNTCADVNPTYDHGTPSCSQGCQLQSGTCSDCGDGTINGSEQCDGSAPSGATCASIGQGFYGGTLGCSAGCSFDTSACNLCGNAIVDSGEQCDGGIGSETCETRGYSSGTLSCSSTCGFVESACIGVFINEVVAGSSTLIELINVQSFVHDISGWQLTAETGAGGENILHTFIGRTLLPAGGSLVIGHGRPGFLDDFPGTLPSTSTIVRLRNAPSAATGATGPVLSAPTGPVAHQTTYADNQADVSWAANAQHVFAASTPSCGDGSRDGLEACDGGDAGGMACYDLDSEPNGVRDFAGGALGCSGCTVTTGACKNFSLTINEYATRPTYVSGTTGSVADELVEIMNLGPDDAPVENWMFFDDPAYWSYRERGRPYLLPAATVPSGGYIYFSRTQTGLGVSNGGEPLSLADPNGVVVQTCGGSSVCFTPATNGLSCCRSPNGTTGPTGFTGCVSSFGSINP